MIDINLIRKNPEKIKQSLLKRMEYVDFSEVLQDDEQRRKLILEVNELQNQRNSITKEIASLKRLNKDTGDLMDRTKGFGSKISSIEIQIKEVEERIQGFLVSLPNIPDDDVNSGGKENNQVVHYFKEVPQFSFKPMNHIDICESLGIIDYERGAKLSGSGSWIYRGWGSRLEWALLNFFINEHIKDGYEFVLVPHMLKYECGYVAGQFPKFEEEVYWLESTEMKEKKFLLPTAETALVNLHRDEILDEKDLPLKYISYTPCYRKEAGSYRAEERGMIRGHQFNKVEMVQYTTPEQSDEAFDELVQKAERLLRELNLHYRLSKLAANDCAFSMAKTFDIEIWIPSMGIYKEVSSVSNARDYQARRGNIRFRQNGKMQYAHTLNGSGLATSRIIPALVEQFQQVDGSVIVPDVLRPYIGVNIIEPWEN